MGSMNLSKLVKSLKRVLSEQAATEDDNWTREDCIALEAKQSGYRAARRVLAALPQERLYSQSTVLSSKIPTQQDLSSNWARYWLSELGERLRFHRQAWEFAYVLQSLRNAHAINSEARALVLGFQRNPLISFLASRGVHQTVLIPPAEIDDSSASMSDRLREASHRHEMIPGDKFDELVVGKVGSLSSQSDELGPFDFIWSLDHLNKLGNAQAIREEILSAVDRLKPGGVAVFAFDLDLSTEGNDPRSQRLRRSDLKLLAKEIIAAGHYLAAVDLKAGEDELDSFIDFPPYRFDHKIKELWKQDVLHMKLLIGGAVCTSFGLTIIRGPGRNQ